MTDIRIANAPVSWGSFEFEGLEGESIAYGQMLDELCDTGYVGTELGDWGYTMLKISHAALMNTCCASRWVSSQRSRPSTFPA